MPAQPLSPPSPDNVTVEYGLFGDLLETTAGRFVSAAREDPFRTWLLLPTKRLVLAVTENLAANGIPFIASRVCTPEGFCHAVFDEHRTTTRFLSKGEARLLLAQVLRDIATEVPLFALRDRPSSATIEDLMTFMNVTLSRKVAFPGCLGDNAGGKIRQLDRIVTEYRNRLARLDCVDSDTIVLWTIDHLHSGAITSPRTLLLYGFHEPLPLEQDLFTALQERSARVYLVVPDGIDPGLFRRRAASGLPAPFDRSGLRTQITGLFSEAGPLLHGGTIHVRTFPTRYTEISGIAAEICRLGTEGTPLSSIAVVSPDLRGDLGLIEEVFSLFSIPWNAAVGSRLSRAPVVRFLVALAHLPANGYGREALVRVIGSPFFRRNAVPGGSARLDAAEVDLVFRYARIDGPHPDWEGQLGRLFAKLEDPDMARNYPGISASTVERVREGIGALRRDLDALVKKKSFRDHARDFRAFLASWEIPCRNDAPDHGKKDREAREYQAFCLRLDAFSRAAWKESDDPVDFAEFSRLVAAIGEEPDDSGRHDDDGVAVLGVRECPHLDFPVVFVRGLTEGVFPRLTTRLPFTNSLENARMGTRSLSEILREEQYFFIAALLAAKEAVYLSAPLADGEKTLLTSAFFEQLRARARECPWPDYGDSSLSWHTAAVRAGEAILGGKTCSALALIPPALRIDDLAERIGMESCSRRGACDSAYDGILEKDAATRAFLKERFGMDHVWSATGLEIYANCPFAYFLERVIGLSEVPEARPDLSPGDRGTVIHGILSRFYREWRALGRTTIPSAALPLATDLIQRIAQDALKEYSFGSPIWDATRILMLGDKHTGPGFFRRFLESETTEADSPLVPCRFEYSFGMGPDAADDPASSPEPVDLVSPDGLQKLRIRGRIDRIDIAQDGSFVIYDYKSGAQHPRVKEILRGTALQLPLYLLAFQQISGSRGIGAGYYTIRREAERSLVLADGVLRALVTTKVRPTPDYTGTIRHSLDCALAYIDGIRGGRFPLPAEEKCPNPYCAFRRICRFDPFRVLEIPKGDMRCP